MVIRGERILSASREAVWALVSEPVRLREWWPGVTRVEVAGAQAWTTVLNSPKGKTVRADYTRQESHEGSSLSWRQELAGSPFERILSESLTRVELTESGEGTRVVLTLAQRPRGWAHFSPMQMRAAARRQVEGALDGLGAALERQ